MYLSYSMGRCATMRIYIKPINQISTFRTFVFFYFFFNPLWNSDFFHTQGIWNDVCMIADTINDWFAAKFFQFLTRKILAFITAQYIMACRTIQKSMVCTTLTTLTNIVWKTTMTFFTLLNAWININTDSTLEILTFL